MISKLENLSEFAGRTMVKDGRQDGSAEIVRARGNLLNGRISSSQGGPRRHVLCFFFFSDGRGEIGFRSGWENDDVKGISFNVGVRD
ncbi:hypothetical protein GWI33_015452 [Rhynchophorus ferrugineus]|uniref:Uncharacterized protein n=1 Tax=Rhynchophorus ferrugineus TaxID=354439 RepID=A0A834HZR1_RHYFE|nr:hypothetical protein GWI33_015452 [Rhynchophorus ferrugineus]